MLSNAMSKEPTVPWSGIVHKVAQIMSATDGTAADAAGHIAQANLPEQKIPRPGAVTINKTDLSEKERVDFAGNVKPLCKNPAETAETYKAATTRGLADAEQLFEGYQSLAPTQEILVAGHNLGFGAVLRNPGKIRGLGNAVSFGGIMGAEPQRIPIELQMLEKQTVALLNASDTPEKKCATLAFCHARMLAIHPFQDGNGRISRAFLSGQANKLFGPDAGKTILSGIDADKPAYLKALRSAILLKPEPGLAPMDLGPLAEIIGKAVAVATTPTIPSPYRLTGGLVPVHAGMGMISGDADLEVDKMRTGEKFFGAAMAVCDITPEI